MQTTAVYSCVRILAETVASLPIHVYRYTDTGKERVYDHPLYRLLHDEPNLEMTSFVFREMEDMNLISAEEGGDLYLINGNMTKLKDAGLFARKNSGDESAG